MKFIIKPKTIGNKLTGMVQFQMNHIEAIELFGYLPVELRLKILLDTPTKIGGCGDRNKFELLEIYKTGDTLYFSNNPYAILNNSGFVLEKWKIIKLCDTHMELRKIEQKIIDYDHNWRLVPDIIEIDWYNEDVRSRIYYTDTFNGLGYKKKLTYEMMNNTIYGILVNIMNSDIISIDSIWNKNI